MHMTTTTRAVRQRTSSYKSKLLYTAILGVISCASFAAMEYAEGDFFHLRALAAGTAPPTPSTSAATPPTAVKQPQLAQRQAQYIARTTLKSLADAARTGNFTVFRDLTGPSMQARFSSAELHQHFANLAQNPAAFAAISLTDPVLVAARGIAGTTSMRVEGYFPSQPSPLAFAMIVEQHGGRWLVADYAVGITAIASAATSSLATTGSVR